KPYAAGEGNRLGGVIALSISIVVIHVIRPWPLKWILDFLARPEQRGTVDAWVASAPARGLFLLSVLFVALALAGAWADFAQSLLVNGLGNRILYRFRTALFANLMRQPLVFHEARDMGELVTRVLYDTSRLRRGVNGLMIRVFQTMAIFVATLAVLFWIDPLLGTVLAAGGLLAFASMHFRARRIVAASRKQRRKEGKLAALMADDLGSVRELQTFGSSDGATHARFQRKNEKSLKYEQRVRKLASGLVLRVEVLLSLTIAIALWIGATAVQSGRVTPGDLVLFISYAIALRAPFAAFAYQTGRLGRTAACAERLARIMETEPAIQDAAQAIAAPALREGLSLDRVSVRAARKNRSARKVVLDSVSCRVPAGARTAVVGGNGSGKSTLLRLIPRLLEPSSGSVLYDGKDLRRFSLSSLRSRMSVVFQDSVLAGLSIRHNLALGTAGASDEAIHAVAREVGMAGFIERLPNGYDTRVRRSGDLFSGGERQRLAIARALIRDGSIWLLDEPATGLDEDAAREMVGILFRATEGRTTLWVTHDSELVERMDWVIELSEGRIQYTGPAADYVRSHAVGV
ncbi:MAG TPA: ABC transporter ATP-binding protein, partial [Gemmatimonadaceae bacterium]|nr:ABC transporter ATP-binding protein [Gemmatimonadaceae bacterium]